jgi:hypothetical protein
MSAGASHRTVERNFPPVTRLNQSQKKVLLHNWN